MRKIVLCVLLAAGLALCGNAVGAKVLPPSGGPDGGGYYWFDQSDNTAFFNDYWTDISGTGTLLSISDGDDDYCQAGFLPYDFVFYDTAYPNIWVSCNGAVYFEDVYMTYSNYAIPSDNGCTDTFMAPFWTDLYPSSGGDIYYQDFGDHFIVMYDGVDDIDGEYSITCELIGFEAEDGENSDIAFLYNSASTDSSCTIGIQGATTIGTQSEYNPGSVNPGDFYLFTANEDYFEGYTVVETSWGNIKASF